MKKPFDLLNVLILLLLMGLILGPRPLAGTLDLMAAYRFEVTGNFAGAAGSYASAAARLPWKHSLWERAGEMAQLDGNAQNTILYLTTAVKQGATTKAGWLDLGKAYQQRGDTSSALNAWEQALPLAEGYAHLAQVQQKAGNFKAAIENWQANVSQEPGNANAYYQLGLLFAATDLSQALPELMKAAQLNPDLEKPTQNLRASLNTALLSDNGAYQFLVSGQALAALGQWDLAIEAFHNAIDLNGNYSEAWAWLGLAKQQTGKDGSFEMLQAINLNSESAIVQGLNGLFLQREGKPDEALVAFQKASTLEPDNPGWQLALGNAFEQIGDLIKAYSAYLHAVELAPDNASTWRALAAFSVNNSVDVVTTGLPAAHKLIELAPNDWLSYDLAGQAALLLVDYKGAEDYLEKAIQLDPTQAAPPLHLGLTYLQNGVLPSAYSYLSLAKTLDPNGPYGWQAGHLLDQYFP